MMSGSKLAWFPFYPSDYLGDTMDLSAEEHGVYHLLLHRYWLQGPLPDDLDRLCRISAGASPQSVRTILERYWVLSAHGWDNPRLQVLKQQQVEKHNSKAIGAALTNFRRYGDDKSRAILERFNVPLPKTSLSDSLSDSPSTRNQNQNQNQKEDINIGGNFVAPIEKVPAKKPAKRFIPPTVAEVAAYCTERGNQVDPAKFVDHYEAGGWMRNKTKIKSWKAAVRTWENNNATYSNNTARPESAHDRRKRINQEIRDRAMSHFSDVG